MYHDLTKGSISRSLLLFALPMMAGNLLQQFYNIADTLIIGSAGGGRLVVYADDIPDLDLSGTQHGLRRAVFHLPGKGR